MGKARSIWGGLLTLLGVPSDIQGIVSISAAFLPVGGAAGLYAMLTQWAPWALFIGTGTFCFGVVAAIVLNERYRRTRLDDKLNIVNIMVAQRINIGAPDLPLFQPYISVQSFAHFPIYYRVTKATYRFGSDSEMRLSEIQELRAVVPPFGTVSFAPPPTARYVPLEMGRFVISLEYGAEREAMTHRLDTTIDAISPLYIAANQSGDHGMLMTPLKLEVSRL